MKKLICLVFGFALTAAAVAEPPVVVTGITFGSPTVFASETQFKDSICTAIEGIRRRHQAAIDVGGELVIAFPEHVGTLLAGIDEPIPFSADSFATKHSAEINSIAMKFGVSKQRAFSISLARKVRLPFLNAFAEAARRYETIIVSGTVPWCEPENSANVSSCAFIFDKGGYSHLVAKKIALDDDERNRLDLCAGDIPDQHVFIMDHVTLGVMIGGDVTNSEIGSFLTNKGAQIIVRLSASPTFTVVAP